MNDVSYRDMLILAKQKSQEDYDKAVISLSGGGLGISLLFIKDIIGKSEPNQINAIIVAWTFWAASIASVVISYYLSHEAIDKAIDQFDREDDQSETGGLAARITKYFNAISGMFFIVGIAFFIFFVVNNMEERRVSDKKVTQTVYAQDGFIPPKAPPKTVVAQKPKPAPKPKTNK